MKNASTTLINFLAGNNEFICVDLFTITQLNGNILYLTNADKVITWGGIGYSPYGLMVSGLHYKLNIGLEADEQTVYINADPSMTMDGLPFITAVQSGSLDLARITRDRAYLADWYSAPIGVINLFSGYVSRINSVTRTTVEINVKSDVSKLDIPMPRNIYQASCLHTLYDGGCKVSKSAYTTAGAVGTGSTNIIINYASATPAYYWEGVIIFTTGANAGQSRTIKNSTGTAFILAYPLPHTPATGDMFNVSAGCDKTSATCTTRFNNLANIKAYPFIPTAETSI